MWERPKGNYPVAIQGIQRSGTNFLTALLDQGSYRILNRLDPKRHDPRHKHCRWQADKSTIVMDDQYRNTLSASSVREINTLCGYAPETKHIILFRAPEPWLNSIFRWGLEAEWYPSEDAFFEQQLHVAYWREWDAFYAFWQDRQRQEPDQVLIVSHKKMIENPQDGLKRIDAFMGVVRAPHETAFTPIEKVRHSRPIGEKREPLDRAELTDVLDMPTQFDWQSYMQGNEQA
ncbi:sulfotransferase domain-containing protein [Pacificibacter sp. AS14]|uniref:sulfotransferase domain-containing protein n=1 Tax=Pacificibacter sp. AS14 TaxID=3135785 RepID=UPI00319DDE8C